MEGSVVKKQINRVRNARKALRALKLFAQGYRFGRRFPDLAQIPVNEPEVKPNPLEVYFDGHLEGPGIWKWRHYFSIYHRHLAKFRGEDVHVVEIGVFSGGSLGMWREYFGEASHIYGVDIDPACKAYESNGVEIFIGDQADPAFWREFLRRVPRIDVVIDDGGHLAHQQIVTLEALLPAMAPRGVYVCEDLHGPLNGFQGYVAGLAQHLNRGDLSRFQQTVKSVHSYPFLTVIERHAAGGITFDDPRRGTEWLPQIQGWEFDPALPRKT
jgi:hypothetical protein